MNRQNCQKCDYLQGRLDEAIHLLRFFVLVMDGCDRNLKTSPAAQMELRGIYEDAKTAAREVRYDP